MESSVVASVLDLAPSCSSTEIWQIVERVRKDNGIEVKNVLHSDFVYLTAKDLMSESLQMEWEANHFALIYRVYRDNLSHGLLFTIPFRGAE